MRTKIFYSGQSTTFAAPLVWRQVPRTRWVEFEELKAAERKVENEGRARSGRRRRTVGDSSTSLR